MSEKLIQLIENAKIDFQTALAYPFHLLPKQVFENHLSIELSPEDFTEVRSTRSNYFFLDSSGTTVRLFAQGIRVTDNPRVRRGTVRVVLGFVAG